MAARRIDPMPSAPRGHPIASTSRADQLALLDGAGEAFGSWSW
jgi:hypothetical protein